MTSPLSRTTPACPLFKGVADRWFERHSRRCLTVPRVELDSIPTRPGDPAPQFAPTFSPRKGRSVPWSGILGSREFGMTVEKVRNELYHNPRRQESASLQELGKVKRGSLCRHRTGQWLRGSCLVDRHSQRYPTTIPSINTKLKGFRTSLNSLSVCK